MMKMFATAILFLFVSAPAWAGACDTGDNDTRIACWTAARTTAQIGDAAAQTEAAHRGFRNTVMLANQRLSALETQKYAPPDALTHWRLSQ